MIAPMTRVVALFTLVLLVAGCGGGSTTPSDSPNGRLAANLRVTVVASPVCPVERIPPDPACAPRPVEGAVLQISGTAETEIRSGVDGLAAARLAPGDYLLTPEPVEGLLGVAAPQTFTIGAEEVAELVVDYDTGIR